MWLGRIGAGLALLMLGSVAAGCGGGLAAPQAQGEVAGPVTKPRVAAFAREVRLRAGDFPGSTTLPTEDSDDDENFERQPGGCSGLDLDDTTVATFETPTFRYARGEEVAAFLSEVSAAPTPYEAKNQFRLLTSKRGFNCLREVILRSAHERAADGVEVRDVSISRLSTPLPPTPEAFGLRIGGTEVEGETETRIYADTLAFSSGPAVVTLTAISTPTPVNQNVERVLMATLYDRAANSDF